MLWSTYLPGILWIFGLPFELLFGNLAQLYLQYVCFYNFLEVIFAGKDFWHWIIRPLRRMVVGWNVFWVAILCSVIPLLNFITAPLYAWVAVADYYDYNYSISPTFDYLFGLEDDTIEEIKIERQIDKIQS